MPGGGGLVYFDKPIARRYHARISGLQSAAPRRSKYRTPEEIRAEVPRGMGLMGKDSG
jgi:hypothetical protein